MKGIAGIQYYSNYDFIITIYACSGDLGVSITAYHTQLPLLHVSRLGCVGVTVAIRSTAKLNQAKTLSKL